MYFRNGNQRELGFRKKTKSKIIILGNNSGKDNQDLWEELEEVPIEVDEFDSLFSRPQVKIFQILLFFDNFCGEKLT